MTKGVAFIDFKLSVSAAAAIDSMNNQMFNGKALKVNYATQKNKSNSGPASVSGFPPFVGGMIILIIILFL
jgi:RNA recognition motif-containing protein